MGRPGLVLVNLHQSPQPSPIVVDVEVLILPGRHDGNAEMCSGSEAGSYLRRIDSRITQLKAPGPSRTCNESKEEEGWGVRCRANMAHVRQSRPDSGLGFQEKVLEPF